MAGRSTTLRPVCVPAVWNFGGAQVWPSRVWGIELCVPRPSLTATVPLLFCTVLLTGAAAATIFSSAGRARRSVPATPLDIRVFINSASESELALLPHIGPRLAERIVVARQASGGFSSVADIAKVRGIGLKAAGAIGPMIRFD